ncbi:MAG TPA: PDZ domain-containing protein [Planctomycetota bacterium]
MRSVKLYNALLWLVNAALGAAICLFFFKYLLHPADYTRDVRLDEGNDTASVAPKPQVSDASLRIRNPIEQKIEATQGPAAVNFHAILKGTLPGEKGDGPGAAFLKSKTKPNEMVAFVDEKILFEGKEFDDFRGWTLAKVWKDKALFKGPNGLTQELSIESEAITGAPGTRVAPGVRGARAGQAYQSDQFKSRLLASADSRQVWGLDPAEIDWASQNADRIMDSDFQVSPNAGGGIRIEGVTPGSIGAARGMLAGDVVRDVNGQALTSIADLRTLMNNPAFKNQNGLRVTVERAGKPVVLEYRPLPR